MIRFTRFIPHGGSLEREAELRTLCDPRVRDALAEHGFSSSVITIFPVC
jgi:predicted glycoside hydrolase/deacetylase ChbG (UPF0249 family)